MPPRNTDPGPRSHMDRFLEWADQNLWGDPQPRAYDDMPATDFSYDEMQGIFDYEARNPMSRQNRAVQGIGQASRAVGSVADGMASLVRPQPEPVPGPTLMEQELANTRKGAEIALIDYLLRGLANPPTVPQGQAGSVPPRGFEQGGMPYMPEFEGESLNDPEVQRMMEDRRFQMMMQARGRPLNPPE